MTSNKIFTLVFLILLSGNMFADEIFSSNPGNNYTKPKPTNELVDIATSEPILNNWNINEIINNSIVEKRRSDCEAYFEYYEEQQSIIKFFDFSTPFVNISWQWDFGDGENAVEQNPVHHYERPGYYDVCLTIVDSITGCTDTWCEQIIVYGGYSCMAYFSYYNQPLFPMTFYFVDGSTGDPDSWFWDFGDGASSSEQDPFHTYTEEGIYDVCLTIINTTTNCEDTECYQIVVDSTGFNECYAMFFEYPMGELTIQFTDYSWPDPIEWLWEFGDGNTSTQQHPTHQYSQSGIYPVTLSIITEDLCEATITREIWVEDMYDCDAFFLWDPDLENPMEINFTDLSYFQGDVEYFWDFGDGFTSTQSSPTHLYIEEGEYEVFLTIFSDNPFCQDTYSDIVFVDDLNPDCEAEFDYSIIPNGSQVSFIDLSTGNINQWNWDFGDGNFSGEQNPVHTFAETGNYQVCLTVANNEPLQQCEDEICKTVEVFIIAECEADFDFTFNPNGSQVSFIDLSIGNINEWNWDFGDGNFSDEQNPVHTFAETGNYQVCLTVANNEPLQQCEDEICKTVEIFIVAECEADFSYSLSQEFLPAIQFTDQSTGNITSWFWDFGDGTTSTEQSPYHVFPDSGNYIIKLTISNLDTLLFCSDSIQQEVFVFVEIPNCQADFVMHPDSGVNTPNLFHFHDLSINEPDVWLWDFGDGNTSTEQNPTHQYQDGGFYNISLTVTKLNPWGENCTNIKMTEMQTPEYFHIGGFVYTGNFPINNPEHTGDTAIVYLYRYHGSNNIICIDTSIVVDNGYFHLLYLLESNYILKFRLTDGSTNASYYFPTYYGNKMRWQFAPTFALADSNNYHVNVNLFQIPEFEGGVGTITGSVSLHTNTDIDAPAEDSEILIFDSSDQAVGYVHSTADGGFQFHNLAFGTYTIYAESTGMFTEGITVTLSETNPSVFDVQLELFDSDITSTHDFEKPTISAISIYPNPVTNILNVSINKPVNQNLTFRIIDYSGREILTTDFSFDNGSNQTTINTATLSNGLYFLQVFSVSGDISETRKFVK